MGRYFLGNILGLLIPIIIVSVGVFACCVALCCFCCKKSTRRRREDVTTVICTHPPPQQLPVSGWLPSYPAYQPVPLHAHGGQPVTPPPSYLEATSPAFYPNNPGPPMVLHPSQPLGHPDVHPQPPYNPAFSS